MKDKLGQQYAETTPNGLLITEERGRFYCRRFYTHERRAVIARDLRRERERFLANRPVITIGY